MCVTVCLDLLTARALNYSFNCADSKLPPWGRKHVGDAMHMCASRPWPDSTQPDALLISIKEGVRKAAQKRKDVIAR